MLDVVPIEGLLVSKRLSIIPTVFYTREQNTDISGARILSCSRLEQPLHLYRLGYKQCLRIIGSIMEYILRNFCHAGHFLFPSPTLTIHCQVFMEKSAHSLVPRTSYSVTGHGQALFIFPQIFFSIG